MTASNHAAPVRANAVDYAALARAAASLRFPAPFDMLVTLVGGVITLCADLRQNREDAHRLLQTAVALANTLAALPPRNSDSDVAAHAKRLSDTLGKIHEYLGKEKEKEKRSFFKLVFTKLHQAATTSQIKLQIAQFDKDLQVEIASLTASVAVKLLTHAQTGGFNDAQMKQLIGAFRSEDAGYSRMIKEVLAKIAEKNPQPQQKRETIALAAYLLRQNELRNIDSAHEEELARIKTWYGQNCPKKEEESWSVISAENIQFSPESMPIQFGVHFLTYEGTYLDQTVSVKVFEVEGSGPHQIPWNMIERAIKKEMENWKKLSALPNVHTLIGVTPAYPPKLIAEFCPNQVDGYIMSHPEQLFRVLYELISGLQDIHNHNVIHRDLSPRNVLITCEGVVAISDFGMSRKNAAEASNSLNAPHLRRPEINFQSPDSFVNRNASSEIDIWSFGMLAYYLVTGTEPYAGKSYEETSDLIQAGVLPLRPEGREYIEITNRFGVELEPLFLMIRGCWLRDPLRRFDSKVIKSILESSYRNEIGVAPARA